MSLSQHYSVELSSCVSTNHQLYNDNSSMAQTLKDLTVMKQPDIDEKDYFHSLNNRLEDFLHYLDDLEWRNKILYQDLHLIITKWSIAEETQIQRSQVLNNLLKHLSGQTLRKTCTDVEIKIFDEQLHLVDRIQVIFCDAFNFYTNKQELLFNLINQLEYELHRIEIQLSVSDVELQSNMDEYQNELVKFYHYLSEWSQLTLDTQKLSNEIQSLKEYSNLRLGSNQEEINDWNRLVNRLTQESTNFYQNSLEKIKQLLQNDYEQMIKEQQTEIEIVWTTKLKKLEDKIHMHSLHYDHDKQQYHEETQQFENDLHKFTTEYDDLESDYRKLSEEIKDKRQIIQNLENQARLKLLKCMEQHAYLEYETDINREEYYMLKDELDQLIYTLRFSIEEELKVYETLLNSLDRKDNMPSTTDESKCCRLSKTTIINTTDIDHSSEHQISNVPTDIKSIADPECINFELSEIQKDMYDQKDIITKRICVHEMDTQQEQMNRNDHQNIQNISQYQDDIAQNTIHIRRKYKGKVIIKSVDIQGCFVEIENIGNRSYDLSGWYIERRVDDQRINYTFTSFELDSHKVVRIYGNSYQQVSSSITDDSYIRLFVSNLSDWSTGRQMHTELFNCSGTFRASFVQTIAD